MVKLEQGNPVEPITYPGYSRATKKRKRKELTDTLDRTLKPGRFALVDLPCDDDNFKLRFCLVKITRVWANCIDFEYWVYSGYPAAENPDYKSCWQPHIQSGSKKNKADTGWCRARDVVLVFDKLTRSKKIPNQGRTAPLKLLYRALTGEFGPLPADRNTSDPSDTSDSDYIGDEVEGSVTVRTMRTRQSKKHRAK